MTDAPEDPGAADEAALVSVAIGPRNREFYERYLAAAGERFRPSWNWPAFFVTGFWLLYRKLWLEALGYLLGVPVAIGVLVGVPLILLGVAEPVADNVLLGVSLAVTFLLFPLYANALYAAKLRRLLRKARQSHGDPASRTRWLARHGGTSWAWLVLLVVPMIGILGAVSLPAYQSYVRNAESVRVQSHYEEAVRIVRSGMAAADADLQLDRRSLVELETAWNRPEYWVEHLNGQGWTRPDGGAAFAAVEQDETGVIGVRASGSLLDGSYVVTLSRPQYGEFAHLPVERTSIRWANTGAQRAPDGRGL